MTVPTQLNKVPYTIAPADASGAAVDLAKFPTALTGITWKGDNDAVGTVTPAADGLSAEVVRVSAGTVNVTVSGTNVAGSVVTQSDAVVFEVVVPVVTNLNLTAGTPTA
jgi:hypothetical protein